jgi:hypothetical protein
MPPSPLALANFLQLSAPISGEHQDRIESSEKI